MHPDIGLDELEKYGGFKQDSNYEQYNELAENYDKILDVIGYPDPGLLF